MLWAVTILWELRRISAHRRSVICGVQDGVMEDEPRQIASHYLRTWFAIDLVACLPVQYVEYAVHAGKG